MRYARLIDDVVVEIIERDDIENQFHQDFVSSLIKCDSAVKEGMIYTGEGGFKCRDVEQTQEEKAAEQYAAIDNVIHQRLKVHDYDSVGELALAASGGQWQEEAQLLNSWVQECWEIMDKIKNGVITFDSIHDALLSLPELDSYSVVK